MKVQVYRLFEIVAWPAAAWCAFELLLRTATGDLAGAGPTALTGCMAAITIVLCRWRTALPAAARP